MIRTRARNAALALSLLAVVTTSLTPGSQIAAAAALPAEMSVTDAQADTSVRVLGTPRPRIVFDLLKLGIHETFMQQDGPVNTYGFHVRADAGTLHDVTVTIGSQYTASYGGNTQFSPKLVQNLGTISAPSYRNVQFTCSPPIGYYCESVVVSATSSEGETAVFADGRDGEKNGL